MNEGAAWFLFKRVKRARKLPRVEKKKGKPKSHKELTGVTAVALQTMFDAALVADEIFVLQKCVGVLKGEQQRLRERSADWESQSEALFATLKRRVVDPQEEIKVISR